MTTLKRLALFLLLAALVTGVLFAANAATGAENMAVRERPAEMAASAFGAGVDGATRPERGGFHPHEEDFGLAGFMSTLAPIALVILVVTQAPRLFGPLRRKRQPTALPRS